MVENINLLEGDSDSKSQWQGWASDSILNFLSLSESLGQPGGRGDPVTCYALYSLASGHFDMSSRGMVYQALIITPRSYDYWPTAQWWLSDIKNRGHTSFHSGS